MLLFIFLNCCKALFQAVEQTAMLALHVMLLQSKPFSAKAVSKPAAWHHPCRLSRVEMAAL